MRPDSDYTSRARRFVLRFPILNYLLTQINFWMVANTLLGIIVYLSNQSLLISFSLASTNSMWPNVLIGLITGFLSGISFGLMDYFFDKQFFRNMALGKIIIMKATLSIIVITLIFNLLRFVLFDAIIVRALYGDIPTINDQSWRYLFIQILIYSFFMSLVINFINQVNKKFGPGVLLPLLLGKYRVPREEERIFLFMDLKSSTALAESLGHLQYSEFIRDSLMDVNRVLQPFNAEVYQYVGDEIVLSWKTNEGLANLSCVQFFFACEKQFQHKADYYMQTYGQVPEFKAGLHMGKVTAVEIGEIKRDIAYHGDTLNTAARIQSMCNDYQKKFLVSDYFLERSHLNNHFKIETLGMTILKGKTTPVGILSVESSL